MASPSVPPLTRFQKWVLTLVTEDYYGAWELRPDGRALLPAVGDVELARQVRDEVMSMRDQGLVDLWVGHDGGALKRVEEYEGPFDWTAETSWAIPGAGDVQLLVNSTAEGDRIYQEHWDPSWN